MSNIAVVCYNVQERSPILFNSTLFSVKLKTEERSSKSSNYNLFEKREGQKENIEKHTETIFFTYFHCL